MVGGHRLSWAAFWDSYDAGRWEPETWAWLRSVIEPGALFVDVGAWIGPTSLWAVQLGAEVIAVEPDDVAYDELRRICPRVESYRAALVVDSLAETRLGMKPAEGGGFWGDSMSRIVESGGVLVDSVSWDELLNGRRADVVKIDVEGFEVELVPAIVDRLAGAHVQISCHGELLERELFSAWSRVEIPDDVHGDIRLTP